MTDRARFVASFDELAAIGRTASGGWRRFAWTPDDQAARAWFERTASTVGLEVECDRNGNLWAWWGRRGPDAVVTGSHLDTVADGGAYDGALGVVSGLLAIGVLAAHVPAAMLFVRNPTGASHTPAETASVEDCLVGIDALTTVLEDLVWG